MLSLYAKGLTTGEISAHFADVHGAWVVKDTVTRITNRVIEEMKAWWSRPLEGVYTPPPCSSTRSRSGTATEARDGGPQRPVYAATGERPCMGTTPGHVGGDRGWGVDEARDGGVERAEEPQRKRPVLRRL